MCLQAIIIFSHKTHTPFGLNACKTCKSEIFHQYRRMYLFLSFFFDFPFSFFLLSCLRVSFFFTFFLYVFNSHFLSCVRKTYISTGEPIFFCPFSSIFLFPSFFSPAFAFLSFLLSFYMLLIHTFFPVSEKLTSVQANLSFSVLFLRFSFFLLSSLLPSQLFLFYFLFICY
jgi:hypothetical protein